MYGGWKEGRMDGWKEGKAGLRIAYSNQKEKSNYLETLGGGYKLRCCFLERRKSFFMHSTGALTSKTAHIVTSRWCYLAGEQDIQKPWIDGIDFVR